MIGKDTKQTLRVLEIKFGSAHYDDATRLRYRVLREPLGLNYTPEQLAAEADDLHLGAYNGELLVGFLLLTRLDANTVQMRQVAVIPEEQGKGVGRLMVVASEQAAIDRAYSKMVLHAREAAVGFYSRLGYECEGKEFEEVGIPHIKMVKLLTGDRVS